MLNPVHNPGWKPIVISTTKLGKFIRLKYTNIFKNVMHIFWHQPVIIKSVKMEVLVILF